MYIVCFIVIPSILHIVTHEYIGANCALCPGERLVVVDNGDKDWKHGFKVEKPKFLEFFNKFWGNPFFSGCNVGIKFLLN